MLLEYEDEYVDAVLAGVAPLSGDQITTILSRKSPSYTTSISRLINNNFDNLTPAHILPIMHRGARNDFITIGGAALCPKLAPTTHIQSALDTSYRHFFTAFYNVKACKNTEQPVFVGLESVPTDKQIQQGLQDKTLRPVVFAAFQSRMNEEEILHWVRSDTCAALNALDEQRLTQDVMQAAIDNSDWSDLSRICAGRGIAGGFRTVHPKWRWWRTESFNHVREHLTPSQIERLQAIARDTPPTTKTIDQRARQWLAGA